MTIVLPVATRRVRRQRDATEPDGVPLPTPDRVPRVTRMLALAHHWRGLIRDGVVKDQAALARLVGVSRARVTQVMDLLYLAPDIQTAILFATASAPRAEGNLRSVAATPLWTQQREALRMFGPYRSPVQSWDAATPPLEARGRDPAT